VDLLGYVGKLEVRWEKGKGVVDVPFVVAEVGLGILVFVLEE
jgi:hypothetical protein